MTTEARHCPECQETGTGNPEMTVTLTYKQVRYLNQALINYAYGGNCVSPAEKAENQDARDALRKGLDTLEHDDHGNVWQVTR